MRRCRNAKNPRRVRRHFTVPIPTALVTGLRRSSNLTCILAKNMIVPGISRTCASPCRQVLHRQCCRRRKTTPQLCYKRTIRKRCRGHHLPMNCHKTLITGSLLRTNILILMSTTRTTRTKISSPMAKDRRIQMPVVLKLSFLRS